MALDHVLFFLHPSSESAVLSAVDSLKLVYTIVLSLSIAEAFKQFVNETSTEKSQRRIHWDRLLALIGFLLLAVPFIHGMNRYFFEVYSTASGRPYPEYWYFLLFDTALFTIEAGMFFVLSRSLPNADWHRFYLTVALLLSVDIFWGSFVAWFHTPRVNGWLLVNTTVLFLLAALLKWAPKNDLLGASLGVAIILLRTILDYSVLRDFYFP